MDRRLRMETITSTPITSTVSNFIFNGLSPPSSIGSSLNEAEIKVKRSTYLEMVVEAVNTIGVRNKGASYQAIRKWIIDNKGMDNQRTKVALRVAVKKGIDNGILVRPKRSESVVGALGFFMVAAEKHTSKAFKNMQISKKKTKDGEILNKVVNEKEDKTTKNSPQKTKKISPSKAILKEKSEAEKNLAIKATLKGKTKVDKKPATAPLKGKAEAVKEFAKAPLRGKAEADKKPATAPLRGKAEADKKPATAPLRGKAEVEKNLKMKSPSKEKDELEKNPPAKQSSQVKTERKPTANPPSNIKAEKLALKDPAKAEKKPATNAPSKEKVQKLHEKEIPDVFGNSDPAKEGFISKASKNEKVNEKNKAEESETVKSKVGDSVKDKKGKVVKPLKKLPKYDETYFNQTKSIQNTAKTVDNDKQCTSEDEWKREGVFDFEVATGRKKHKKMHKTFSSDTELEVSKREEKRVKRALRVKKGAEH